MLRCPTSFLWRAAVRQIMGMLLLTSIVAICSVQAERLVVVSPHWEGIKYEFARAFSAWHLRRSGEAVEIEWLDLGGTAEIVRYIRSEFSRSPQGVRIDVVFGGGIDPYLEFVRDGLLEPLALRPEVLDGLPAELHGAPLRDEQGRWYAAVIGAFGMVCSRPVLERLELPVPARWEDLADPRFRSWFSSADPGKSGSAHVSYELLLQVYGWRGGWGLIRRLATNTREFTGAAGQTFADAVSGDIACAFALDSQAATLMNQFGAQNFAFVAPEGATTVTGDAVAVLRGAPRRDLAQAFVEFVLSPEGQRLWMLRPGAPGGPKRYNLARLAVRPAVYAEAAGETDAALNPFTLAGIKRYDAAQGSRRWALLNDLFKVFIIEPIGRPLDPSDYCSEEQAEALAASGRLQDARERSALMTAWREGAAQPGGQRRILFRLLPLCLCLVVLLFSLVRSNVVRRK